MTLPIVQLPMTNTMPFGMTDVGALQLQYQWNLQQMALNSMMPGFVQPAQGRPLVQVVAPQVNTLSQPQPVQKTQPRQKQSAKERKRKAASMTTERPCSHNSWDNVRVVRKKMTLRCRMCQEQWRAPVEIIWKQWKCEHFAQDGKCPNGDNCQKLHLHYRKQGLEERLTAHGPSVLKYVRNASRQAKSPTTETSNSSASFTTEKEADLLDDLSVLVDKSLAGMDDDNEDNALSSSASGSFGTEEEAVPEEALTSNELAALLSNLKVN